MQEHVLATNAAMYSRGAVSAEVQRALDARSEEASKALDAAMDAVSFSTPVRS